MGHMGILLYYTRSHILRKGDNKDRGLGLEARVLGYFMWEVLHAAPLECPRLYCDATRITA